MYRLAQVALSVLFAGSVATAAVAQDAGTAEAGKLAYRGFTVDVSAIQTDAGFAGERRALEHQLDIVADCGARPDALAFFRSQPIAVIPGARAHFARRSGIEVSAQLPPQQPIVLHELLHAYHAYMLPDGVRNADIMAFYDEARSRQLYPARAYVLRNPGEFFAVTASLYLWGHVDRPPGTRESLRSVQPRYYAWLGQLFGVEK